MPDHVHLLIAPVWNWNQTGTERGSAKDDTFNRTSLELKPANPPARRETAGADF